MAVSWVRIPPPAKLRLALSEDKRIPWYRRSAQKINWAERHHLYLGQLLSFPGKAVFLIGLGMHNWTWIGIGIALSIVGDFYSADDFIQHRYDVSTPVHKLDVWLNKLGVYRKIAEWVDKHIFMKKEEKQDGISVG